ncbi:MAG TPA: regulatory protein RecX [Candidatus Saccharimonadales bacterium]|nr:regulatory protein RecX [Candidatus Saccharimonadales bacterium]
MKITGIRAQEKNKERVAIYVDGKYSFSLSQDQLLRERLAAGTELDDQRLTELKEKSQFGKLLAHVLKFVLMRPHSVREIEQYLYRKKADLEVYQRLVDYLDEHGYLNDEKFAQAWVASRMQTKAVSKRRILSELRQKGVADDVAQAAVDEEGYDEMEALKEVIDKKRKLTRYKSDDKKFVAFLLRQGFGYDLVQRVLGEESDDQSFYSTTLPDTDELSLSD